MADPGFCSPMNCSDVAKAMATRSVSTLTVFFETYGEFTIGPVLVTYSRHVQLLVTVPQQTCNNKPATVS